ncbi:hypothetical protein OH805_11285 [Streptomyces sp. NBC_00879]|uniref:hypothetical protein n=1 Tax=Streptomyces sp. NBC_00879 TaxID=2975855 RepID=UPI003868C41F|nr:hypothetical protein OH805_11285 [Streptomyces sp. NBC_00879]
MTVSPQTEQALREAMGRLLAGNPNRTDGALTKNNLWREAGVSRATMNRATGVLSEWDRRVGESPVTTLEREHREELSEARRKLRTSRQECRQLQDQVDAAATVITALLAENAVLREQAAKRSAVVIPLDRAHATRE